MKPTVRCWVILVILMLGLGTCMFQQLSISNLIPQLRNTMGLSAIQSGYIFTAFSIGMLVGYVLMTLITALAGTRWGLTVGFAGIGLASIAQGLAGNLIILMMARFALGFFFAGLIPAAVQVIREWFPTILRPLAIGILLASYLTAAMLSSLLFEFLVNAKGWRIVLEVAALPAILVAILCVILIKLPPPEAPVRFSAGGMLSALMLVLGLFLAAPILTLSSWTPIHLERTFGMSMSSLSHMSMLISAGRLVGVLFAGAIACVLIVIGLRPPKARATLLTLCGCLLPLIAIAGLVNTSGATIAVSFLAIAGYWAVETLLYSAVADTLPVRGVAIAVAAGGFAVALINIVSAAGIGYLVDNTGFRTVFLVVGCLGLIAWFVVAIPAWFVKQPDTTAPSPQL